MKRKAGSQYLYSYGNDDENNAVWFNGQEILNLWEDMVIELKYLPDEIITEYKLRKIDDEPPVWVAKAEWFYKYYDIATEEGKELLNDIAQNAEKEFLSYVKEHPNGYMKRFKFNTFEEKLESCRELGDWTRDQFNGRYAFLYTKKTDVHLNCVTLQVYHQHALGYKTFNLFLVYKKSYSLKKKPFCDIGREIRKLHDRLKRLEPEWDLKLHMLYNEREDNSVWHERKKYYTDMETGQKWVWTYKTDSVYSREDGWWYEEPKAL